MIFVNPEAKVNKDIPNIGLAYAATHFKMRVVDQNTRPYPKDRFLNYETEVLGISVKSLTYGESLRIARLYRSKYPDGKVKSISGFLDTQCCYPYLDFEDKIEYAEPFSDNYPFPNYELFDSFDLFRKNWQGGIWSYAIMTSQGCPYQCLYCMSRDKEWRIRSTENCYEELKGAQERWGIKSFVVLDDCFNVDKERVINFCELIRPLGLNWTCANGIRADRFDEDMAKAMSISGCKRVSFGIESIVPEVLEAIRKDETLDQIERAIDIARRYFKKVSGFFIIGLPRSSYEKDLASLRWAVNKRIKAHFSYYVPFDKSAQHDSLFYGEGAHPLADEYPKELQARIYEMTKRMRGETFKIGFIRRTLAPWGLISTFNKNNLCLYLVNGSKRLIVKMKVLSNKE